MKTNELNQIHAVDHLDRRSFGHWTCDTSPPRRPLGSDDPNNFSWIVNCLIGHSKEE
jgi:hypothetical protein